MNQILNFGKNKGNEEIGSKPVIKFFVVAIILFGLILIAEGIYNIYLKKDNHSASQTTTPILSLEQEGSSIIIGVEYKNGIDRIIYYWNDGEEAIIQTAGKTKISEKIPMPIGTSTLSVSLIDTSGKLIRYAKREFTFDSTIDSNKPNIEITKGSSTGTIKIIVTDDKELKSVKYKWDEDDEMPQQISEGISYFELEVAAKEGERKITITAVDTSNNEEVITKTIKGTKKPEISASKSGENLIIKITDDNKVSHINYKFNGQEFTIDDINEIEYELKLQLAPGDNYISIKAYDEDGLTAEYNGKCKL